jgi:hypothetical protein
MIPVVMTFVAMIRTLIPSPVTLCGMFNIIQIASDLLVADVTEVNTLFD